MPVIGFTFDIKTDMYINTDGKLLLNNGYSSVVDKYIDLTTSGNLYIYNPNSLVLDQTKFLTSELQDVHVVGCNRRPCRVGVVRSRW
jgi:hypothetical protein